MPRETELLEGLRYVIPDRRPAAPVDPGETTDLIVHHFFNLADRTERGRDDLLEILKCDGHATEDSKARSLAFLAVADRVSASSPPGLALDQIELLLAVWFVVERDPDRFDEILASGRPSLLDLATDGSLGKAMRTLQMTPDYAAAKLTVGTGS